MLTLKIQKNLELLKQQLENIELEISDPIERIEQKKLIERKIKKLEQSKSQIEQLAQEQQELELLKSEFLINDCNSSDRIEEEGNNSVTNNSNINEFNSDFDATVEEEIKSKPKQSNLERSSQTNYNKSQANINIKYLAIFSIVFGSVIVTILIINSIANQKAEQARLQELARQQVILAQQEAEQAKQQQAKAEQEKQEAIRAREEAEKATQAAMQAKQEVQKQLQASNQIESNSLSFTQQKTVNLNNPQEQIDRLADRTFYSQYPELRGRKIRDDELFLKQEWLQIRNCEATVDYLFYQQHPELEQRKILPSETSLGQEWLRIRNNTSGCN